MAAVKYNLPLPSFPLYIFLLKSNILKIIMLKNAK